MWAIAINCLYFALMALVILLILYLKDSKKVVLTFITGCATLAYCSFMITSGYFIFILAAIAVAIFTYMFNCPDKDKVSVRNKDLWLATVLIFVLLWNLSDIMLYKYEEQDGIVEFSEQELRKKEEAFRQSLPYRTSDSKHLPYLLSVVGGDACLQDLNSFRCDMFRKLIINKYEFEVEKEKDNRRKKSAEALEKREKVEQEVAEFKNRTKE